MAVPGILWFSAAHLWGNCAGSFAMEQASPKDDGEEARQGTAAHFFVTEAVRGRILPAGTITPNGVPIDEEMIECGMAFLAWAATLPPERHVERKLSARLHVHSDCEGRPDIYALDRRAHTLDVGDYKYGHRFVDPFRNEQLCASVAGVLEAEGITRDEFKGWRVRLTIVQPRNYHRDGPVRTWDTLGHVVMDQVTRLSAAAQRAKSPEAPTTPGDHCRDCTARHACDALHKTAGVAMDVAGSNVPLDLSDAALGLQLALVRRARARLDALQTGLEQVALAKIRAGGRVPGWGVERGNGREVWDCAQDMVLAIGQASGVDLSKPGVLTPNQARQAGVPAPVVSQFSKRPLGETKLVPMDASAAAKAFS